ncbi:MAG TPA: NRDE family protein [Rhodanobacteraceae bacterium]
MCVLAFAWNVHPRWRLLLVGNRDEAHARPSASLQHWDDAPAVIAGRDLEAGGTWMGVREPGRAAVVTNVRDPQAAREGASRGLLVADFLQGDDAATGYAGSLAAVAARYRPFNLLLFDADTAAFVSNRPAVRSQAIADGVHGVSNGDLDSDWPKVRRVTAALRQWLDAGATDFNGLLDAFGDECVAADAALPDTGVGLEFERRLSPVFVRGDLYGTRATTLIALDRDGGGQVIERRFGANGVPQGQAEVRFDGRAR